MSLDSLNRSGVQTSNPALYDTLKDLINFQNSQNTQKSSSGVLYDPNKLGGPGSYLFSSGTDIFWQNNFTTIVRQDTGVNGNYNPGINGNSIIICQNPALLTIGGFTVGYPGQIVIIRATTSFVNLNHFSLGTKDTKLYNGITSNATPLNIGGYAIYIYCNGAFFSGENAWVLVGYNQGLGIAYTPSVAFTLGNGSVVGNYTLNGNQINFSFTFIWGSTSSIPGGTPFTFGLPFNASINSRAIGIGMMVESGVQDYGGLTMFNNSPTTIIFFTAGLTPGSLVNGSPWAFAPNDTIIASGSYYTF